MSFGKITKLTVNIGKCQTHITYADNTTRCQMSNPSGFVFRTMNGLTDCRSCADDDDVQAFNFLQRHFGRGRCGVEKTPLLRDLLVSVGLNEYADYTTDYMEQQQQREEQERREQAERERQQKLELHTWQLERMTKPKARRATKVSRLMGQLQVLNISWHLQNCKWRKHNAIEFQLPKCHCTKIKETMDYINELVNTSMPTPDPQKGKKEDEQKQMEHDQQPKEQPPIKFGSQMMPDMNGNIININSLLQELNELLELQTQEQCAAVNE